MGLGCGLETRAGTASEEPRVLVAPAAAAAEGTRIQRRRDRVPIVAAYAGECDAALARAGASGCAGRCTPPSCPASHPSRCSSSTRGSLSVPRNAGDRCPASEQDDHPPFEFEAHTGWRYLVGGAGAIASSCLPACGGTADLVSGSPEVLLQVTTSLPCWSAWRG